VNNEEIEQAVEGLKLQRFWPHVDDIVMDAGRALQAIDELQARYEMMTTLANVTADTSADRIDELLARIEELEQRNRALEVMVDRMTSKDDWEILIDMQRDQLKVRKAFKKVIKQLDDLNRDVA
jgi:Mg2+ and Co2+ transporter CorA